MAGSLTLRLTQTDPDPDRHIPLNPFVEAVYSILGGWHTQTQVENFYNMTASDKTAFGILVGKITSTLDLAERMLRAHRVRSILTFWEQGDIAAYDTEDEIETHLLAIDTGP